MVNGSQIVLWNTRQLSTSFDHLLAHLLWARCLGRWWCLHRFYSSLVNELIKRRNLNMLMLSTFKKLKKKKTIQWLSPPFLGTSSNNCNWAAIAPVEKRLIDIGCWLICFYVRMISKTNLLKDRPPPPLAIVCWTSRELPCKHSSLRL